MEFLRAISVFEYCIAFIVIWNNKVTDNLEDLLRFYEVNEKKGKVTLSVRNNASDGVGCDVHIERMGASAFDITQGLVNAYLRHVSPDIAVYVNDCVGEISQQVKTDDGNEFVDEVFKEMIFRNPNYESILSKWRDACTGKKRKEYSLTVRCSDSLDSLVT
jgi:hypothetical protein